MNSMKTKAGFIGVRSALIGSLLFAIAEGIAFRIVATETTTESIRTNFLYMALFFCIGSVLSILPRYLGERKLMKLAQTSNWNRRSLMIIGATFGIAAVVLISLPYLYIVLAGHNYWSIKGNPAFPIYILRLTEAIIIAGLMGSWSGSLIANSRPMPRNPI